MSTMVSSEPFDRNSTASFGSMGSFVVDVSTGSFSLDFSEGGKNKSSRRKTQHGQPCFEGIFHGEMTDDFVLF